MRRPAALAAVPVALLLGGCGAGTKPSDSSHATPSLRIVAPQRDAVFALVETKATVTEKGADGKETTKEVLSKSAPEVEVFLDLQSYEIGRVEDGASGQHVHLILDDEPYDAIYDVSKAIRLGADLKKKLTPGTHVLRVFPSAGPKDGKGALHHEARKHPGAFAWTRFHVGARGGDLSIDFDPTAPFLTYSRPKGAYVAGSPEHAKFLVDWYQTNVTLEKAGLHVVATLDGKKVGDWTTWAPQVLAEADRPGVGEHTLKLELLDRDDKPVPGPFNATTRKFTVVEKK